MFMHTHIYICMYIYIYIDVPLYENSYTRADVYICTRCLVHLSTPLVECCLYVMLVPLGKCCCMCNPTPMLPVATHKNAPSIARWVTLLSRQQIRGPTRKHAQCTW